MISLSNRCFTGFAHSSTVITVKIYKKASGSKRDRQIAESEALSYEAQEKQSASDIQCGLPTQSKRLARHSSPVFNLISLLNMRIAGFTINNQRIQKCKQNTSVGEYLSSITRDEGASKRKRDQILF